MNTSHLVCNHLGHSGASATVSGNVFSPDGPHDDLEYGAIRCKETAMSISDCWYEPRESDHVSPDMVIAVICCTSLTCGPKGETLGMRNPDIIPNSAITESSCNDSTSCGAAGRLYSSSSSWTPSAGDFISPWVQVSFSSLYIITDVVTQGHHEENRWVTSYTLSSSLDSGQWLEYRDAYTSSGPTVFPGTYRLSTPVEHSLNPPLIASSLRLHPRTYFVSPSLRFDLQGFGPLADYIRGIYEPSLSCVPTLGNRLGVENPDIIPDSSITASEFFGTYAHGMKPSQGRLLGGLAWGVRQTDQPGWWWKVDLGVLYHVTGVIIQGRIDYDRQWIRSYKVSLSLDDAAWINVGEDECGSWKEFPGTFDRTSLVTNLFPIPLSARYVKLFPISFYRWVSLRCEILGF